MKNLKDQIEKLKTKVEQIEINSASDLYSKFGKKYPYASDIVAKFIFGYNEIDNEIVNSIKNNKLDEYELSEFMLDYEYSWEENMETINDYVKNLINNN
jgi:protein subunit release factor A